ncbi:hypothetical protein AXG93_4491s1190 [Marchantia polymorpha subsp. ruderalis]|uniref:Uncharacterized protein n=1 Tax=Marchantia polymorpha subsp. ruderalis TaxID=1480154 RepID=A0A176WQG3_MARPO|nr:hypothetical protein AXG93_4491s1190 [Marchantia polymorpha subsp. ruderalis]
MCNLLLSVCLDKESQIRQPCAWFCNPCVRASAEEQSAHVCKYGALLGGRHDYSRSRKRNLGKAQVSGTEILIELLKLESGIEELREKRDEIKKILQVEEEEKANIQKDLVVLTKRLAEIDDSLSRKYAYTNEYDKTIHEVEAAYSKIMESSQALLHVLKSDQF